ncbi:MAG TPA: glycosyltransferase family 39 protein [Terriglobales bacterium]|nr:glycosyltransferase family 39 protein [Terriglobales bacterium]
MNTQATRVSVASTVQSEHPASLAAAWMFAAAAVSLQMAFAGRYGYFRDELYYLALSHHLDWGFVDLAPLSPLILRMVRFLLGDSLHAIRLLPALAQGAQIVLTGLIVRELGGKRFAVLMACLAVWLCPVALANSDRYSMNAFEPLFWMGCIYFLLLAINRNRPQLLVWCGVLVGVGVENKHSTAFFLISLSLGLLVTQRQLFRSKWLWIAAAIIVLLCLPNLIWQFQHGFPTWVDLTNVRKTHKNVELPPLPFFGQQIMMLLPTNALLWIIGLGYLLFHGEGKRYRVLGVTYLFFLAIMMALHGKDYYLAPIYPMLLAAGGVFWERLISSRSRLGWLKGALPVILGVTGVAVVPVVMPILPPERVAPYMAALGINLPRTETGMKSVLPQYFADEFGWEEMVAQVAQVYNSMSPEERAKTAILGGNYGSAGAIDFFGGRYGLPKAISAHQNYFYWGFRDYTGESIIMLNWPVEGAQHWCQSVEKGPVIFHPYTMSWEHYTILKCRGLKKPLEEAWPHFKSWN